MENKATRFGTKPLSYRKYFFNNQKRSISMIMALAVSVMMIVIFQMVAHVVVESSRIAMTSRLERITVIYPGEKGTISQEVVERISNNAEIDKLIPMYSETTDYYHLFGNLNIPVYIIGEEDLDYSLKGLGLTLKDGRIPKVGKNEILLDWRTANNKNVRIGDFIGREVDPNERMPGKYEVVGILDGDVLIGILPIEARRLILNNGMLVFPKSEGLDLFNKSLGEIPPEDIRYHTKEYGERIFEENKKTLAILTSIVAIAILFVMSFAAGNASYAQYYSRRYEFGILQAIGYNKAQILLKAAKEIALTSIIGMVIGLFMSVLLGMGVIKVYFESKGYPFALVNLDGLIKIFIVPICTAVFSLIPSGWVLSKIDPMMIIEKFE